MERIRAFFMAVIAMIMSILGYLQPTENFDVKTPAASSWNGKSIMFQGKEIGVSADCEAVLGGAAPVFRFESTASLKMKANAKGFNYYGLVYESTNDLKCEMTYSEHTEVFFLKKTTAPETFYSYTENFEKGKNITSLKLYDLNGKPAEFSLLGLSVFNRNAPSDYLYLSNGSYKIGVSAVRGGTLDYMECLKGNVQAVKLSDGTVKVDRDAKAKYGGELLTSNVNLINRYDEGRCIQQSYYGTKGKKDDYVTGFYNGHSWPYNPVQGGNLDGDRSRLIDYKVTSNSIYVKCRPLDWAKPASEITDSYMEATYTLLDNAVKCDCSFVDFSGYAARKTKQELPAVYFIEPLNSFAYKNNNSFVYENDLKFWGEYRDQIFESDESISGLFCGENGFGAGVYSPCTTTIKAGVYMRDKESVLDSDPSSCKPTSYLSPIKDIKFASFKPIEYSFVIATGTADEIDSVFADFKGSLK